MKKQMIDAVTIALSDSENKFELYEDVKQKHAKGILVVGCLTQWPEWPHCLQNCAATALMGSEAQTLMAGGSPVKVKALRTKRVSTWMSSAR